MPRSGPVVILGITNMLTQLSDPKGHLTIRTTGSRSSSICAANVLDPGQTVLGESCVQSRGGSRIDNKANAQAAPMSRDSYQERAPRKIQKAINAAMRTWRAR